MLGLLYVLYSSIFHLFFYHQFDSYCCIVDYIVQVYVRGQMHAFRQYKSLYSIHIIVFHGRLSLILAFYYCMVLYFCLLR
jgi:hypothetical protein